MKLLSIPTGVLREELYARSLEAARTKLRAPEAVRCRCGTVRVGPGDCPLCKQQTELEAEVN